MVKIFFRQPETFYHLIFYLLYPFRQHENYQLLVFIIKIYKRHFLPHSFRQVQK
ncbi:MAG: hypothetical protein IJV35_05100 [Neisseriaceae bacterium]|nr:hypothetical protein [Neisseriaceae bacterium]